MSELTGVIERMVPMDGILDELLRLESAKREALVNCDSDSYETCVSAQVQLIDNPLVSSEAQNSLQKLREFSRLAGINAGLYLNLLSTAPWVALSTAGYSESGDISEIATPRRVWGTV
jgi:hypothetical protein